MANFALKANDSGAVIAVKFFFHYHARWFKCLAFQAEAGGIIIIGVPMDGAEEIIFKSTLNCD